MATEITTQAQVETNRHTEKELHKEPLEHERAPETTPTPAEPHRDEGEHTTHSLTFTLPFFRARFEVPRPPSGPFHVGPMTLPSPGKAVYYMGLGALALAEVVEWPVAVAIGAATYVAQHTRADEPALPHLEHAEHADTERHERSEQREPAEQREQNERREPTEPAVAPA